MNITRRTAVLGTALIATGRAMPAFAAGYPEHPVKIIVPFGAGGPADVFSRQAAQVLQDRLKESFVVENRPGAGSIIGTDAVAKSQADGYTLLSMSNTQTTNESLVPNKPYQLMRDFAAVSPINSSDLLMVVHPSVPAKNLREFIAYAKANPGKLNYASSGVGTPYHMAGELFKSMTGTDIVHVPHKASGEARNSVLGGHVQMMFDAITTMAENVKAGQVRPLGTSGAVRSKILPDVPTVAEAGVPGYETTIWLGIMAPKNTPKDVVNKLNTEMQAMMDSPELIAAWDKQGAVPMKMTAAQFETMLTKDIAKWEKVVKEAGIKPI